MASGKLYYYGKEGEMRAAGESRTFIRLQQLSRRPSFRRTTYSVKGALHSCVWYS